MQQTTATRWSGANIDINLDNLGLLGKGSKSAAPSMKQLQKQTSVPTATVLGKHVDIYLLLGFSIIQQATVH